MAVPALRRCPLWFRADAAAPHTDNCPCAFLDFDGTLTELAPRPEAVRIASGLIPTLSSLHAQLGGALAIVTGRPEADIDGFLAPLRLPLASEHGAQYRLFDTSPATAPPALEPVLQAARAWPRAPPRPAGGDQTRELPPHYRLAPHLESLCHDTLVQAMREVDGVELLRGKCVFEVKPRGVTKARPSSTS